MQIQALKSGFMIFKNNFNRLVAFRDTSKAYYY